MRVLSVLSAAALFLIVVNVSPQTVKTDRDKTFNLAQLKTFDFKSIHHPPGDLIYDGSDTDKRMKKALEAELSQHGYTRATNGTPDFYITYFSTVKSKSGTVDRGPEIPGYSGGRDIREVSSIEGTVVIDFLDSKTNNGVWRAYVRNTLDRRHPQERINRAVRKVIDGFLEDIAKTK